jgi:tRNA 2-thiouridine synthesizing protein E
MADPASTVRLDPEGFLIKLDDWAPAVARDIANDEGIILTEQHWEVLNLLRQYYAEFDSSPAMRPLVKYCAMALGKDKGKSLYLLSLFPGSPAKIGCKIAGLPKPDNCL